MVLVLTHLIKELVKTNGIEFVLATVGVNPDQPVETKTVSSSSKVTTWGLPLLWQERSY